MAKLTKQQFCDLANRHEEIKRKRKVAEIIKRDEPDNQYLKPWIRRGASEL